MICTTCQTETMITYIDKCPQCYAFDIFKLFPPTGDEISNANSLGKCCGHEQPGREKQCVRCQLIADHYQAYISSKQLKLF